MNQTSARLEGYNSTLKRIGVLRRFAALCLCILMSWSLEDSSRDAYAQLNNPKSNPERDVLPRPCATDPAYSEFEKIQADAYLSDRHYRVLLFTPEDKKRLIDEFVREMEKESPGLNTVAGYSVDGSSVQEKKYEMEHLEIPTCYENPIFYYLLNQWAQDIEASRKRLKLRAPGKPKFGTIPSNDINAYMYPTADGRDGIIAFNTSLVNFIMQMSKLAVNAINSKLDRGEASDSSVVADLLLGIRYNTGAQDEFVSSIAGLLLGIPYARVQQDSAQTVLGAFFAGATERFVFAHEYGHLIKGDVSPKIPMSTGATGSIEHVVSARTWPQEFGADSVGLDLMIEALLHSRSQYMLHTNGREPDYYAFALRAPLFFFKCVEVLDAARFMLQNGAIPPRLSDGERQEIRKCAEIGFGPKQTEQCSKLMSASHPPAWLRAERLEPKIGKALASLPRNDFTLAADQKGRILVVAINQYWEATSSELLRRVIAAGSQ
jgi:hypothetical protein